MTRIKLLAAAAALALAGGCNQAAEPSGEPPQANPQANMVDPQEQARRDARAEARREAGELRFVVDLSDRRLQIFRGEEVVRTHDVAVGTSEHPTPTGSWRFTRVDINPEWVPPDSEWAEDRERQGPGDPDNPMGRARLVFNMPYTIHGTDALDSLGSRASHGSIRVSNEVVVQLAELLLRAGGAWDGEAWFTNMTGTRDREFKVDLPEPVPIEVVD